MYNKTKTHSAALWKSICGCFFAEKRCLVCHAPFIPTNEPYLCPQCIIKRKQQQACKLCGYVLASDVDICLECIQNPPPWDMLNYYGPYDGLLKNLVLKYKFTADFALIPLLCQYLYEAYQNVPACDIIIPMPRHKKRLITEGFNHILELCRPLSKQLKIPLQYKSLTRTRYTPPQSSLPAIQRKTNPQKSFLANNVENKTILLVDDIITTGSTLHYASLALRNAGAKHIYAIVIARVTK